LTGLASAREVVVYKVDSMVEEAEAVTEVNVDDKGVVMLASSPGFVM
jgi:hypothetical protein